MIEWDNKPPENQHPGISVVTIKANESKKFLLLGPYQGVWLHWVDNRSKPCLGNECPYHQAPRRWKAYCPAARGVRNLQTGQTENEKVILELTEGAANAIDTRLVGSDYRGAVVGFVRGATWKSPLKVESIERFTGDIPEAFDIRPVLFRMWGTYQIAKNVATNKSLERPTNRNILKGHFGDVQSA